MAKNKSKIYWERNIEGFSGFYDKGSEETISASFPFNLLYKQLVFPFEKKYMKIRYNMVNDFISKFVHPGQRVADIGAGSGIFSIIMAEKEASVIALDFANASIELTKKNVPSKLNDRIDIRLFDVMKQKIEPVDVAISIGVLPYIKEANKYLANICPQTDYFLFNFLDSGATLNKIRKKISLLDVRGYYYHSLEDILKELESYGFKDNKFDRLSTGFMITAKKI